MIREATPADAAVMADTEARAGRGAWTEAQLREQLQVPHAMAWTDGEGGFALSTVVLDEAELLLIAVPPERQRQGRARALLQHAQRAWAARGATRALLEVRVDNAPAQALYRAEGWSPAGLRRRYYRDGTDAIIMDLDL
ncbi:MAG: ribosomal protein S18-alanine N-acetyltransferase [Deltaproteobacteria bacterium]|nr:ribosomal protein S18-alanine N-acetyltransferase [Deltaproteobacteria bacterium]